MYSSTFLFELQASTATVTLLETKTPRRPSVSCQIPEVFSSALFVKRYVDDLFLGSGVLCKTCLLSVVEFVYCPYISFDENTELIDMPEGSVAVKFVDAWFVFNSVDKTLYQ